MKNLFFLFIFTFFGGAVFAGNPETAPNHGGLITPEVENFCKLEAPALISSSYNINGTVTVSFHSVQYAIAYRVELYEAQNLMTPLYSYLTTDTTTTFLLPTGMNIVYKIRAQCSDGSFSESFLTETIHNGGIGIIIELVNNGYQAPVPANGWGMPKYSGGGYGDSHFILDANKSYRITVGGLDGVLQEIYAYKPSSAQTLYLGSTCNIFGATLLGRYNVPTTNQTYQCTNSGYATALRSCSIQSTIATMYKILTATNSTASQSQFSLSFSHPFNTIATNPNIEIFEIPTIYDCENTRVFGEIPPKKSNEPGGGRGHSDNSPNTTEYTLTAAPNPFTDHLTVLLEATGSTDLQLVDMSGKVWRSQSTEQVAGDLAYIETTDMPVGIYLLRVQTSKGIVTKKVVKIAQ
jgi:hypothetical protein